MTSIIYHSGRVILQCNIGTTVGDTYMKEFYETVDKLICLCHTLMVKFYPWNLPLWKYWIYCFCNCYHTISSCLPRKETASHRLLLDYFVSLSADDKKYEDVFKVVGNYVKWKCSAEGFVGGWCSLLLDEWVMRYIIHTCVWPCFIV